MKRKILVVPTLLLILSLGIAIAAEAQGMTEDGRLWARGAGYAELQGDLVADISGHGAATIRVKNAAVLRAQGHGRRWDLPDGTTVLAGWRGHIHAEGQALQVQMVGGVLELTAGGHGEAFLKGRGHYRYGGQTGRWTLEGIRLPLP